MPVSVSIYRASARLHRRTWSARSHSREDADRSHPNNRDAGCERLSRGTIARTENPERDAGGGQAKAEEADVGAGHRGIQPLAQLALAVADGGYGEVRQTEQHAYP